MLETTFLKKLLALGLACVVGGFVVVGCVDNSGNKTYPRGDSGADGGDDVSVTDDAATGSDAPAADAPASDGSTSDRSAAEAALPVDAGGLDVRVDTGAAG